MKKRVYVCRSFSRLLQNTMKMIYVRDMLTDLEKKDEEERWKFCVQSTKSVFAMELSSLFLRSFDPSYLHAAHRDVSVKYYST